MALRAWFRDCGETIQDERESLRVDGEEVLIADEEGGKLIYVPGCHVFGMRQGIYPRFALLRVFDCPAAMPRASWFESLTVRRPGSREHITGDAARHSPGRSE